MWALLGALLLASGGSVSGSPVNYLEPRSNNGQQPAFYGAASQGNSPEFSVRGKQGAVSSEVDICSNIGAQLLQEGGSAIDAVIGTALCVGSIASYHSGLGGGGHALLRSPITQDGNTNKKRSTGQDAQSKSANYIHVDFREVAPSLSTENMYAAQPNTSLYGGLAVGVPGEPKAWWDLHQKYGQLEWAKVFEPAIELNRQGFKVTTELAKAINTTTYPFLCSDSLWAEVYCPNGKAAQLGDTIKKERFAKTLELIAQKGIDPYYYGEIAEDIVDTIHNNNVYKGIMKLEDLYNYNVEFRQPRNVTLRNGKYKLFGTVAPLLVVLCSPPCRRLISIMLMDRRTWPMSMCQRTVLSKRTSSRTVNEQTTATQSLSATCQHLRVNTYSCRSPRRTRPRSTILAPSLRHTTFLATRTRKY